MKRKVMFFDDGNNGVKVYRESAPKRFVLIHESRHGDASNFEAEMNLVRQFSEDGESVRAKVFSGETIVHSERSCLAFCPCRGIRR